MFMVSDEAAAAIRKAFIEDGDAQAVAELRRFFRVDDDAAALGAARAIASWRPPDESPPARRLAPKRRAKAAPPT